MTCRHENADHLKPGQSFRRWDCDDTKAVRAIVEQFRCLDCGAWLSLGYSDETPVAHEIRAAEIAANLEGEGCWMSPFERWGFNDELPTTRGGGVVMFDTPSQRAGYLARCIVEHTP